MPKPILDYVLPPFVRRTARPLLDHKPMLALNIGALLLSGVCMGAGMSMLIPVCTVMLDTHKSIREVIQEKMVGQPFFNTPGRLLLDIVPQDQFRAFVAVMACIAVLTLVGAIAKYLQSLATSWTIARTIQHWQKRIMERVCRMRVEESWKRSSTDIVGTLLFETNNLGTGLNYLMGQAANALVRVVTCLVTAFAIDWKVTLMALLSVAVIGGMVAIINRTIRKSLSDESIARTGLLVEAERTSGNPITIKMACSEFVERRRFHRAAQTGMKLSLMRMKIRALSSNMNELLGTLGLCVVASIAAYWILVEHTYQASTFVQVLIALAASLASLKPLADFSHDMQICDVSSERMLSMYDAMQVEEVAWRERKDRPKLPRLSGSIEFQDISYTYPGKEEPAIRDLSLTIRAGEFVAIVGANGSGKSTLMLLLSRMVDPQRGRICFDGRDIAGVDLRSLRQQMTMVAQKTVLFQGTICDNIAYGRSWEKREDVVAAAKTATADEFILQMPGGYDMKLGPAGAGLSGGQAQRICIARAILRDPALLILDEATSQVDPESEGRIAAAMAQITKGRTTIAIAHRLSTVINADRIIVMDQGRIVAQGTHKELLAASADYRSIAQTQMGG